MTRKILIVEDEPKIARTIRLYLEQDGFSVKIEHDGGKAMSVFQSENPDMVILDLMLPNVDGRVICSQIRQFSDVPIIMLTSRSEESDKLLGLELGADDYITKPFSPREVVARVKTVLRRSRGQVEPPKALIAGGLRIDLDQRNVFLDENEVELTRIEFDILLKMISQKGRVFTRLQLLEAVQGIAFEGYERSIDQHIKNLRAKLHEDAKNPRFIKTVFGVGYRFLSQEDDNA